MDLVKAFRQDCGMRYLWYLAQAAFIAWLTHGVATTHPAKSLGEVIIIFVIAVSLCAFLTACLTQLWDRGVRRLRGLEGHRGEAGGDSLSLTRTRRSLSKTPEHAERIRVSE